MIVRLTGTLVEVTEESVVIERDGVGRELLVPPFTIGELAAHRGSVVTLHTVEFLEASQASNQLVPRLMGFLHPEDRLFFSRFVGVKGIGPRKALKALVQPVRRIASWVESGDAEELAQLPGIGARGAQMIIASLRGKMHDLALVTSPGADDGGAVKLSQAQRDAIEILVAWGDTRGDAQRWLERAGQLYSDVASADEWVRAAYRVKTGVEG
ncbi:MAG: Holliday junction branch migration protein RuvA [Phycisphaerae bacterium]